MKITILHLTDLHINNRIVYEKEKIDSLVNILANDHFSKNILILVSGDISYSGKREQFDIAENFLTQIKSSLESNNKRVFLAFCPGNHDRSFAENESIDSSFIFSLNADNYVEAINSHSHLLNEYNCFACKQENFKKINDVLDCFKFKIEGKTVAVYSLNNSYLSAYLKDGKENVDYNYESTFIPYDLLDISRKNEEYTFLLMHMPMRYLLSKTRNFLNNLCSNNVDIVFDGHVHEESITIKNDGYAELTSSALYSNDASGFTLLHVNKNKVLPFIYVFDNSSGSKKYRRDSESLNSFDFVKKTTTIDGFKVNKNFIDSETNIKVKDRIEISVDDIFVFPPLSEERYRVTSEKKHIESFDRFLDFIKNKVLINIIGDESSGKTTLARQLFYSFIQKGFSPLLCDGKQFESLSTNKNVRERVLCQIKNSYTNTKIEDDYFDLPLKNRVLILDNFEFVSTNLLEGCAELFSKIIFFSDVDAVRDFNVNTFPNLSSAILNIEPLFRNKREEMCRKIYSTMMDIKPDVEDNITMESFVLTVEKLIDKMDASYMASPSFLFEISVKVLLNLESYSGGKNLSYQKEHYTYLIGEAIVKGKYDKCTPYIVERILSDVAYNAYKGTINDIEKSFFEDSLLREINEYETTPFTDVKFLIDLLIEARMIEESQTKGSCYRFHSLKIFAYYIGKYAMTHHNSQDEEPFDLIISRGIYSKLNFNILMSIAYNYDVENIPNYFVKDLYEEVCVNYSPIIKDLNGIKAYFLKEKKRISKIDEREKKAIRKRISRNESKERDEYVANIDNYYYEKTVDASIKELVELSNKSQIVASLLNYSDLLKGPQKRKLAQIAITLPNMTVDRYIGHVQKQLDIFYIKILDELEHENDKEKANSIISQVDIFFDYLVSIITATILTFYDNGSRPLSNPIMNEKLQEALNDKNSDIFKMPIIQRLMLMSFSNKEDSFIGEITKYLDEEKDSYNRHTAALIARRYCIDNYYHLQRDKKAFLSKIQGIFGKSVLIEANKK